MDILGKKIEINGKKPKWLHPDDVVTLNSASYYSYAPVEVRKWTNVVPAQKYIQLVASHPVYRILDSEFDLFDGDDGWKPYLPESGRPKDWNGKDILLLDADNRLYSYEAWPSSRFLWVHRHVGSPKIVGYKPVEEVRNLAFESVKDHFDLSDTDKRLNYLEDKLGMLRGKPGGFSINITLEERRLFAELLENNIAVLNLEKDASIQERVLEFLENTKDAGCDYEKLEELLEELKPRDPLIKVLEEFRDSNENFLDPEEFRKILAINDLKVVSIDE